MKKDKYIYDAYVTAVYDGDTITVDIDLGLDIFLKNQKIRLFGIDAPEVRGKDKDAGIYVRDWLRLFILDKHIVINTIKDSKGKYGRYLGTIFTDDSKNSINDEMISLRLVERKTY